MCPPVVPSPSPFLSLPGWGTPLIFRTFTKEELSLIAPPPPRSHPPSSPVVLLEVLLWPRRLSSLLSAHCAWTCERYREGPAWPLVTLAAVFVGGLTLRAFREHAVLMGAAAAPRARPLGTIHLLSAVAMALCHPFDAVSRTNPNPAIQSQRPFPPSPSLVESKGTPPRPGSKPPTGCVPVFFAALRNVPFFSFPARPLKGSLPLPARDGGYS